MSDKYVLQIEGWLGDIEFDTDSWEMTERVLKLHKEGEVVAVIPVERIIVFCRKDCVNTETP